MWSAAILAGGRARRFGGRDKGALVVEGRTIGDRQIAELTKLTSDIMIVGGHVSPIPAAARMVADRLPDRGPLAGLQTAPFLDNLLALTREADAVVPRTERGYHPLCAAYTRACLEPVAVRLANGELKMVDFLNDVRVRTVTTDEINGFGDHGRMLANVNTPSEYGALEALQGHQP